MNAVCRHCLNVVPAWSSGVMTYQIAHHHLSTGGLCPGSGEVRSAAR